MIAYPDTSFLCARYRPQDNSARAAHHLAGMPEPLHVASPLIFEFKQSTRWQVFLHAKDPTKGFDQATAQRAFASLRFDMAREIVIVLPVDWTQVTSIAERLSSQYTWTRGYRAFDLLHVATALQLGAREFLTFDAKQSQLAALEGLKSPLF